MLPGRACARPATRRSTTIYDDFEVCIDPEDWPGDEDEPFIVVREVDGYWYESYVETGLAYIRLFLDDYLSDVADRAEV